MSYCANCGTVGSKHQSWCKPKTIPRRSSHQTAISSARDEVVRAAVEWAAIGLDDHREALALERAVAAYLKLKAG